jgi:hypothetical protein
MREREGREEVHEEERRGSSSKELPQSTCVKLSSKDSLYIGGRRAPLPLHQARWD